MIGQKKEDIPEPSLNTTDGLDANPTPFPLTKELAARVTAMQDHAWKLIEDFKANSHIPLYRFQLIGGVTQRQEQLDAQGRLTRIIDVGRQDKLDWPDEGFTVPRKLWVHEIYYRVWDVAPDGKKTLVALGWNRNLRPKFGLGKDTDTLDSAIVVYGLPDGTPKWNEDQFAKQFGFDKYGSVLREQQDKRND